MAKTYPEGIGYQVPKTAYPMDMTEPRFTIDVHKYDAAVQNRDNRIKELEYELEIAREALEESEEDLIREKKNVDRLASLLEWIQTNKSEVQGVQLELPFTAR